MRPVFPSAVVNWFPFIVSVVSPVKPTSSQLKLPVYVPERSVCSVWAVADAAVSVAVVVCRPRFLRVVAFGEPPVVGSVCMAGVASVAFGVDGSCATPVVAAVFLFDLALPRLPLVRIVLLF
jgi:hypothetical protein